MLYRSYDMPLPHLPTDFENLQYFILQYQNRYKYRDGGFDRNLARLIKAYYYAAISFIDYQVGRMLESLQTSGQLENTMIVFTSDHGEYLGDYGCYGKRGMHDASCRIPMIVRYPREFEPRTVCDRPVSLIDLAPTFLNIAKAKADMPLDGCDLRKVVSGEEEREVVFSQYNRGHNANYMAVSQEWKYIYSAAGGQEFLFDRVHDPLETRNCLHTPGKAEPLQKMKSALIEHLTNCGHTECLDGQEWRWFDPIEIPANSTAWQLTQDPGWMDFSIPGYSKKTGNVAPSMLADL
jgi:arylsulfatase A-like enzyme